MTIAYLVNQYPQPSHTFIRREIAALEAAGVPVRRFTVRRYTTALADPADQAEQKRVETILDAGPVALALATLGRMLAHPVTFAGAARLTWKTGRRSDRGLLVNFIYLAEACLLLSRLRAHGVTHLHAHFGTNSTTVAMLCRALGGPPYSFTAHGPEEFDKPQALVLTEKIARAAFVVAITDFARSQLYRWCPLSDWSKIHVVHCGLDAAFLDSARGTTAPHPPPGAKRLVCVGRLSEQKGQLLLLDAAAQLVAAGETFELLLIGDGPMRPEIEARINQLGLQNTVRITGFLSNDRVRQEMLASRATVLASFAEGLPVVIMESLAVGRPVVSTSVGGIPELVRPGETGWLVAPGSVSALTHAMRAALNAPVEELSRLGRNGATIVAEHHDATVEARKLIELFGGMPAAATNATTIERQSPRTAADGQTPTAPAATVGMNAGSATTARM